MYAVCLNLSVCVDKVLSFECRLLCAPAQLTNVFVSKPHVTGVCVLDLVPNSRLPDHVGRCSNLTEAGEHETVELGALCTILPSLRNLSYAASSRRPWRMNLNRVVIICKREREYTQ